MTTHPSYLQISLLSVLNTNILQMPYTFPTIRKESQCVDITKETMNFSEFRRAGFRCQQKLAAMFRFEGRMFRIKHKQCARCHSVSLTEDFMPGESRFCKLCKKDKEKFTCENQAFAIWYTEEGAPQWHVPEVLSRLTIAEQMLIQRLSPYVPVLHIRNGVMGLKGHVCSFPQEIGKIKEV